MLNKKSWQCWNKKTDIKAFITTGTMRSVTYLVQVKNLPKKTCGTFKRKYVWDFSFHCFLTVDIQGYRFLHCSYNTVKPWCCLKNPDSAETNASRTLELAKHLKPLKNNYSYSDVRIKTHIRADCRQIPYSYKYMSFVKPSQFRGIWPCKLYDIVHVDFTVKTVRH